MRTSKRYNSIPVKDKCTLSLCTLSLRTQAIRRCHSNFFPDDLRCYGNEFGDKIDYNSAQVKDNCALFAPTPVYAAVRLYIDSIAMGQILRSTERISGFPHTNMTISTDYIHICNLGLLMPRSLTFKRQT